MDLNYQNYFNEDHESIRALAKDFAQKTIAPVAMDADRTEVFPREIADQMGELGFFGLNIPEEYGGLSMDMSSYVCVMEEIARKSAAATLFISSAMPVVEQLTTNNLMNTLLKDIWNGPKNRTGRVIINLRTRSFGHLQESR